MDTTEKVKSRWTKSFFTTLNTRGDEERYVCDICQKDFASPSNLALHCQVHVIERKFKCEPCQVSFHSQGHLQKHKRSSAHETRVEMTQAFGIPTSDNPRPYGCPECDTAFRKHGHLAKHLRSKSHITKLESNGLIPIGTYAALEKCGQDLKDKLVTTNCEQSLQSLRQIAMHIFHQQPMSDLEMSPGQALDSMNGLGHDMPIPYPHESSSSLSSISAPHQSMQILQMFSPRSTPPTLQFQHGQNHQQPPSTLPPMTLPSSNMMLSQPPLPPLQPPPQISQNHHHHHHNHIHQQTPQQHPSGTSMNDNQAAVSSQMIMMNMMPHLTQAQILDYTISSPQISSPGGSSTSKTPIANDPYSHLGFNSTTTTNKQQHQQQHHYDHQPYQQNDQYHQGSVTNFSSGYNNLGGQQLPMSTPSTMSSCMLMNPSCPSTTGATGYMRH